MRAINVSLASVLALMGCCCPLWSSKADPTPPAPSPVAKKSDDAPKPIDGVKLPPGSEGLFLSISNSLRDGKTTDTEIIGIPAKKAPFRHVPGEGAVLIGMEMGTELSFGQPIIKSIRPIYLTKNGEKLGPWIGKDEPPNPISIKARDGYVVGAIHIKNRIFIEGLSFRFMKVRNNRLKADDFYESEWVGQAGDAKTLGGAGGVLCIGIVGYRGTTKEPCALGVVTAPQP